MSVSRVAPGAEPTVGTRGVGVAPPGVRAWTVTAMVVLFATINWADKAVIGLVAQPLADEYGFTASQIGFAGSAFFFLFSITGAAVGMLGDRVQVRWILFCLAALWGLTQLPILVAGTFVVLILSRIALGAAEGPATAMATTAVFGWFAPEKRGFPAALVTSGASFAKIAAAPLLALVIAAWGWRAGFIAMALASVVWCALWLLIGREGPYARGGNTGKTPALAPHERLPLLRIMRTKSFIGALLGSFMVYGVVAASITWLPSYFEQGLGYSRVESGFMFALPSIVSVAAMFTTTFLTDRLSVRGVGARVTRVWVTVGFLAVGGSALAMLPVFNAPMSVVAVLVIGYGCVGVAIPMMNAVISRVVPVRQLASTLGVFLALQNLSGLISPSLVGFRVEAAKVPLDGYSSAYQLMGLAILIGAVCIAVLIHPERDAKRLAAELAARSAVS